MSVSSIQKNTIYQKKDYKVQKKESESKETEKVKEEVKEKKDTFVAQKNEEKLPTITNQNQQKKSNVDYQATEDLIKLMQAKSILEVRSIIGKIKGKMAQTKAGGGDEEQIRKVVAKMKKVIKKAQSKEKALIAESKMELQIKMKQKNDEKKAEEIGQELQAKRKKRMAKEINDVLNSSNDFSDTSSSSFMNVGDLSMSMPDISSIDINV